MEIFWLGGGFWWFVRLAVCLCILYGMVDNLVTSKLAYGIVFSAIVYCVVNLWRFA